MMRKTKTPNAAEQNKIREEATVTLRRAIADRSFRPTLFLGLRTTARRAFLEDIALEAESLGFLFSRIDAGGLLRERERIRNTIGNECLPSPMPHDAMTCADIPELVLPALFEEAGQNVLATGKGRLLAVNDMERLSGKEPAPSSRDFTGRRNRTCP